MLRKSVRSCVKGSVGYVISIHFRRFRQRKIVLPV